MAAHGTTEEDLAWVSVKNHRHGALNENAQFPRVLTTDQVLSSALVSEPLRLLNCSPVSDGAAAVLLCPLEQASKYTEHPVVIRGAAMATDSMALTDRRDMAFLDAVAAAGARAYEMAGIGPEQVDVAEVHDCFSIAEICCIEALGFAPLGEGRHCARTGETALGGRLPVNTSGGLKSKGHPVGATGVAQAVELFEQLTGGAGERQVPGAEFGLAQNMGGTGASSVVHILQAV
jgi:acetyl-CoA C-acetyltransferase